MPKSLNSFSYFEDKRPNYVTNIPRTKIIQLSRNQLFAYEVRSSIDRAFFGRVLEVVR